MKKFSLILVALLCSCATTYRLPVYIIKASEEADSKGMIRYHVWDMAQKNGHSYFSFLDTTKFAVNDTIKHIGNGKIR